MDQKIKIFWFILLAESLILIFGILSYSDIFKIKTDYQVNITNLNQPFVIDFNQPILRSSVEETIMIKPDIGEYQIKWSKQNRRLTIISKDELIKGRAYKVNFDAKSYALTELNNAKFFFIVRDISFFSQYDFVHLPLAKQSEKVIKIDLIKQRLSIWRDEKKLGEYIVSTGKSSTPTKKGNFSVLTKLPVAYGSGDGQVWKMPYWLGIYEAGGQENGIHELPFINGYRESAVSLGHPVSHGCIRMKIGEAEKVWNWADIGIPVIIF